jgi:hypothetical protein
MVALRICAGLGAGLGAGLWALWALRVAERCPAPRIDRATAAMPILLLNLDQRTDKLELARKRIADLGKTFERSAGVDARANASLVGQSPYITGTRHLGDAGSALAHLRAWERIARGSGPFLVLEDDERPLSLVVCDLVAAAAPGFDIVYMNVLRPHGHIVVDRELCLHRVQPHLLRATWGRQPNTWLSAYLVSPAGARKLLALLAAHPLDMDAAPFDKGLMRHLAHLPHQIDVLVIGETNRYFEHIETDSDRVRRP